MNDNQIIQDQNQVILPMKQCKFGEVHDEKDHPNGCCTSQTNLGTDEKISVQVNTEVDTKNLSCQ